jgi:hypothetical protein
MIIGREGYVGMFAACESESESEIDRVIILCECSIVGIGTYNFLLW